MPRGTFKFATYGGTVTNTGANLEALRRLWLDRELVPEKDIGPGDAGDFDYGAWHVACHLAGAGGVRLAPGGRFLWLTISHEPSVDFYYASVTARTAGGVETVPLDSAEGRLLLRRSRLLGFVEGNSTGRTSARRIFDPTTRFNLWRRQEFDQPVDSPEDGGKVWEHWCTLRDIRPIHAVGSSVLAAYLSLVAALGDRFAPTVARGRRDYGHPKQLCALVIAGFTAPASATWNTKPVPLPPEAERLLLESNEALALQAVERLDWSRPPRYYMFARKIASWSTATQVRRDLRARSRVRGGKR